jgi:methanogenic corrinoid protein MtbC1
MTPKEKAKQLVKIMSIGQKFIDNPEPGESYFVPKNKYAKECAVEAVNEIKEQLITNLDNEISAIHAIYWEKVKQEIEKL